VQRATITITEFIQSGRYPYPIVEVSINGGSAHPVLLDTGSTGLVLAYTPTDLGSSVYSGSFTYGTSGSLSYNTYDATVSFGSGIVTTPTAVAVLTPSSVTAFDTYWNGIPIDGVLGIGSNNSYPGTSIVMSALPGTLSQGALIDGVSNQMVFGPNSQPGIVVDGAPLATLLVQINDGTKVSVSDSYIDTGYNNGYIGSSIYTGGQAPGGTVIPGTKITVYTSDGTLLYSYTTTATNGPAVRTGSVFNTGWTPYALAPIYNGAGPSGLGTTVFSA
jgi:hypothetical protein